ncbi:MAG TPA: acetate--CoA ligase family protein, partial [Methylomirabilota bacterium]|nr:acetate--CoA ligase family protein [Methylomirabilota bacterium]
LVMVGLGGIYVEVFADTAARLAPVSSAEAEAMLDELRMAPLLRGARGEPPVDRAALAGLVSRFSQLLVDLPEIGEIEINPLTVGPATAVAVDARARIGRSEA